MPSICFNNSINTKSQQLPGWGQHYLVGVDVGVCREKCIAVGWLVWFMVCCVLRSLCVPPRRLVQRIKLLFVILLWKAF